MLASDVLASINDTLQVHLMVPKAFLEKNKGQSELPTCTLPEEDALSLLAFIGEAVWDITKVGSPKPPEGSSHG